MNTLPVLPALRVCRVLVGVAAVLIVLLWVAGRLLTDRFAWSQYIWWVPTPVWIALAGVLGAAWLGLARLSHPRGPGRRRRAWRILHWAVACIAIVMLARAAIIEWRLYRFVLPTRDPQDGIRIAHWNPSVPVDSIEPVLRAKADIYFIINGPSRQALHDLAAKLGEDWKVYRVYRMAAITNLPVRRWGATRLGLAGQVMQAYEFIDPTAPDAGRIDEGRALFVELAPSEATGGKAMVIWLVDLPSDPSLLRREVMIEAREAIAAYSGRVFHLDEAGERVAVQHTGGFPEPDVIVGDFNAPRGSRSLSRLVGDRANAYDQAGRGYGATFPRTFPLLQIDLMFVADNWRTIDYDLIDTKDGWHLAQVGELVPE